RQVLRRVVLGAAVPIGGVLIRSRGHQELTGFPEPFSRQSTPTGAHRKPRVRGLRYPILGGLIVTAQVLRSGRLKKHSAPLAQPGDDMVTWVITLDRAKANLS
ncbi:MAG TPA: hypothetical protein VN840_01445, partial [Streptosporangiaceae bacterium]|nr:hypothetical protein [Streptosporangiaceae bacterium]